MSHPAAYENSTRSRLAFISGSNPKLELRPYERRALVRKIRTLENYSGLVTRASHGTAGYVVGSGINPIPSTEDPEFNQRVSEAWEAWSTNAEACDRSGRLTVADLQLSLAAGEVLEGEGFVAFQKAASGLPQFLQIDSQFVGSGFQEDPETYDGVKTDKAGRVKGYYVSSNLIGNSNSFSTTAKFYPKNLLLQFIDHRRAHRLRGKSCLHSAANNIHDLVDLLSLEKQATKTHQGLAVHLKKRTGSTFSLESAFDDAEQDALADGGTDEEFKKKAAKAKLPGVSVLEDPELEDVKLLNSNRPNANLTEFYELIVREVACSTGFPFEFLWNISAVGGAPARYILADAYITIQRKQRLLTRQIMFPIYRWWLASMQKLWRETNGARGIEPGPDKWWSVQWQYPAKATMDIKHDGKQLIELLTHGLTTETAIYEGAGMSRSKQVDLRIDEIAEVLRKCEEADIDPMYYYQHLFKFKNLQDDEEDENKKSKNDE